jgi:hypothetical protein
MVREQSLEVLLHRLGKRAATIRHAAQRDEVDRHNEALRIP